MNIGKACAIFEQIASDKYSERDKLQAIKQVLEMPTHNGITKDEILTAFRWLFNQVTVEENNKQTNADRIHSMSDEELAKEIAEKIECSECPFNGDEDKCGNVGCSELFLEWLQSEVEE